MGRTKPTSDRQSEKNNSRTTTEVAGSDSEPEVMKAGSSKKHDYIEAEQMGIITVENDIDADTPKFVVNVKSVSKSKSY